MEISFAYGWAILYLGPLLPDLVSFKSLLADWKFLGTVMYELGSTIY